MSRIFRIIAIAAVLAAGYCGSALASVTKISGGTTQISVSSAAMSKLGANGVLLSPLAPGTASGSTFSFPISRGRLNKRNLSGQIHQTGGFAISRGTRTVRLRRLEIVSGRSGVWLSALALHQTRPARVRIGHITNLRLSAGTATGKLRLTERSARLIDRLAGKAIAHAGTAVGTITVSPQFG